jgi:alpha-glucosidase (family GH31 glycosyl hydrolase)
MTTIRLDGIGVLCKVTILVIAMGAFSLKALALPGGSQVVLGELPREAAGPAHATAIIEGQVRFEVLAENLVRMEYSPASHFIDAPSVAVLKRDWPTVAFESRREGRWIEIKTSKMTVRYQIGSGQFTAKNLQVKWRDEQAEHAWNPGDKDDQNLGGVGIPDVVALKVMGNWPGPLSRNGYFFLDDSQTALWDRPAAWVIPRPETDSQDWYFFVYGRNYKQMLGQLSEVVGRIPMIPRYVLGPWVSDRAAYSADAWKMIADRFREESIPIDMIGLDTFSSSKTVWACCNTDPEQLPDPEGFFHWMQERGFHVFVNEHYEPLTPESDDHFEAIRKLLGLPSDTKQIPYDLANKKYAVAFMELLHKPLLDMGMAFWWQDGWAGAKMRGLDPAMWTRYVEYEGSEQITGQRTFEICRLGAWGSHRYGAYFTGDITANWSTLDFHIMLDAQAGNVLLPYVATNSADGDITVDRELYLRWMEFNALSPIFWWHSGWGMRFPWEYGPQSVALSRKFLQLRSHLMPYMYSYARQAHDTGLPLVRGMYLEFPDQEKAYAYRHEYMFGQELLAAPISEPGFGKPVVKDVYLPEGEKWLDYFTGKIYDGGQIISYECPIERMPLFVRAGSILPMAPNRNNSDQQPVDPLVLEVYAGKRAEFRLYEDDGTSLEYRKGANAWTPLTFTPGPGDSYTIEAGPGSGRYDGQPKNRRYEVRVHGLLKPGSVEANGRKLEEKQPEEGGQGWNWDKERMVTTIRQTEPVPVQHKVVVRLEGAGTLDDVEILQKALDYRERVRKIRIEEQLKWAMVVDGMEIKMSPHVVRSTDQVEGELNMLIAQPHGLAQYPPHFRAMTNHLLRAFVDEPFESRRTIPEAYAPARKATEILARAAFEPEEIQKMTLELLGCNLVARAYSNPMRDVHDEPTPAIQAKLLYDSDAIGPAKITYKIELPDEGLPGWVQSHPPTAVDPGYTQFNIMTPYETGLGARTFRVDAEITWDGGHVETARDVQWFPTGGETPLNTGNMK